MVDNDGLLTGHDGLLTGHLGVEGPKLADKFLHVSPLLCPSRRQQVAKNDSFRFLYVVYQNCG